MHHHDLAGAVAMGMGILFRRTAMGGPARVSNAPAAFQRLQPDHLFQVAQLAFRAPHLKRSAIAIAAHSNPGGVIPAIFQLLEPIDNDGHHTLLAYVTYDSTHKLKNPVD